MSLLFEEFVENCEEIVNSSSRYPGCEWTRHNDSVNNFYIVLYIFLTIFFN